MMGHKLRTGRIRQRSGIVSKRTPIAELHRSPTNAHTSLEFSRNRYFHERTSSLEERNDRSTGTVNTLLLLHLAYSYLNTSILNVLYTMTSFFSGEKISKIVCHNR